MKNCVPSYTCLHCTENSTIYQHCKAKDIKYCADALTSELSNMLRIMFKEQCSIQCNQNESNVIHHQPNEKVAWF